MLLTPTMPRNQATESAAGIHQIYVAHCLYDEGLFRKAGFGPRAASTSDALVLRFVSEYPVYELPAGLASEGLESAAAPRRLALVRIPGGRQALIHSAYVPDDARGRANSFFSHVLVAPALTAGEALLTWNSPDWRTRCEHEGTSLPALAELPRSGILSDAAVTSFLHRTCEATDADLATAIYPQRLARDPARRRELVRFVLRGCHLAMQARPGSPRCRFYVRAEPGLAALLLYAAVRLLPEGLATQLTFSTYEDAHRTLRLYRHACVVNTYTPEASKELDDDLFTARGYALDTFTQRHSPELRDASEPAVEQWIDLAGEGGWATIDRVHQLLGRNSTSLVSLRDALRAARASERLASGAALPDDLLALRRSPLGQPILEQHRNRVWRVVRDAGAADERLSAEFGALLREHCAELEESITAALRTHAPGDWRPHWRLLWTVLQHEPARFRETVQRLLPDPPFHPEMRFGLLEELNRIPLSPGDLCAVLPALLSGCGVEELTRFGESELPRTWLAHALCHGVLRQETRAYCIHCLHTGDDALLHSLWEHFQHLTDEDQRRAILSWLFPPDEPQAGRFLSRLLRSGCSLRAETLQWLLESLKVWKKHWIEFWGRDDHVGHLLEMLRGLGTDAGLLWEQLLGQIDADVLLPGSSHQQMLLMNLAAVRDRPGPTLPSVVVQAVSDWVALREHFEKASTVPEGKRRAIIDACNRRRLDPLAPLASYFDHFVAPQGMRPEVVDDFVAFFHTFYVAGAEHQHYSSRLIGWLRVVYRSDEESRSALQRYYLEQHVPAEFRWQLADEMHRAGLLLPAVFHDFPKPTGAGDGVEMDSATRSALEDEVFQLTGARRVDDEESNLLLPAIARRGPWLLPCILVGLVGLMLSGLYAGKPQRFAEMLLFMVPLLLLTDSVARQSAGLMLRVLRGEPWPLDAVRRQLRYELSVGLCLGLAGGLLLAGMALAWPGSWRLASCLMVAATGGSAAAAATGLCTPALVHMVFARPWMAAGPLARLPAAVVTLLLFFLLARVLIG